MLILYLILPNTLRVMLASLFIQNLWVILIIQRWNGSWSDLNVIFLGLMNNFFWILSCDIDCNILNSILNAINDFNNLCFTFLILIFLSDNSNSLFFHHFKSIWFLFILLLINTINYLHFISILYNKSVQWFL